MALVDLTSVTTGSITSTTNFLVEDNKTLKRVAQSSLVKTSDISTSQVNSTSKVPSSSLVYSMNNTLTQLNSNLDNRTAYSGSLTDLAETGGINSRRIVWCNGNTTDTPYKEGLTTAADALAIIAMSNSTYGTILYIPSSNPKMFIKTKSATGWSSWNQVLYSSNTNDRFYDASNISLNELLSITTQWNSPFLFAIDWTSDTSPNDNSTLGIGTRNSLWAFTYDGHIYYANDQHGWQQKV